MAKRKRKKPQSEYMKRKLLRKAPPKPKQRHKPKAQKRESKAAKLAGMRMLIREAAKSGAAEAIEHCGNFWSVSDGYKKYIDHQIETQAEALIAAVRKVVTELILVQNRDRKR